MSSMSLSVLALLTEDLLPRGLHKNVHGVYLGTWMVSVYDDGKGSYFRIYLACKNGMWGSVSSASGKTWGYGGPLCDYDFIHPTVEGALLEGWEAFDRVEEHFRTKPAYYNKAKKFFDEFMKLPSEEKVSRFQIRD